jgi:hypothetical protein
MGNTIQCDHIHRGTGRIEQESPDLTIGSFFAWIKFDRAASGAEPAYQEG